MSFKSQSRTGAFQILRPFPLADSAGRHPPASLTPGAMAVLSPQFLLPNSSKAFDLDF